MGATAAPLSIDDAMLLTALDVEIDLPHVAQRVGDGATPIDVVKGKKLVKMHGETHNKIVDMLQNNLDSKDLKNLLTILNKVVSKV